MQTKLFDELVLLVRLQLLVIIHEENRAKNGKEFTWTSHNKISYNLIPNTSEFVLLLLVELTIGSNRKKNEMMPK